MIANIIEKKSFGTVVAAVHAVEFRPPGLPQAHILLFVHSGDTNRHTRATIRDISAGMDALALALAPALHPVPLFFDFDTNNIPDRAVLIMTSAAVKEYEQEGLMKLGLSSTGGTMVHIDLDIPEVKGLTECEIVVNIAHAPRNNIFMEWRKGRHSAIQEILVAFKPYSKDETYVVRAHVVAFTEMYSYETCPTCNIKVDAVVRAKRCRKHGVVEHTKPSGFVKIEISDGSGQQTVTLFDRQVRDITQFTIEELVHYRDVGVNVVEFFNELKERIYLFELKTKTYHGALSLSASKIELDENSATLVLPPIAIKEKVGSLRQLQLLQRHQKPVTILEEASQRMRRERV